MCAATGCHNDRHVVWNAVANDGEALECCPPELLKDPDIILEGVCQYCYALTYGTQYLRYDRDVMIQLVAENPASLMCGSPEMRHDIELVSSAVSQRGYTLMYASEDLRNTREIVMLSVKQQGTALEYVSARLRNNHEVVHAALEQDGEAFHFASDDMRADVNLALLAAQMTILQRDRNIIELKDEVKKAEAKMESELQRKDYRIDFLEREIKNRHDDKKAPGTATKDLSQTTDIDALMRALDIPEIDKSPKRPKGTANTAASREVPSTAGGGFGSTMASARSAPSNRGMTWGAETVTIGTQTESLGALLTMSSDDGAPKSARGQRRGQGVHQYTVDAPRGPSTRSTKLSIEPPFWKAGEGNLILKPTAV